MTMPRWIIISMFVVGFIGFLDASYLTANHFFNMVPPCIITDGCEVVTTSSYSKILGIPVALMGTLFYVTVLTLWLMYIDKKKIWVPKLLPIVTGSGFLFSLWLLSVQAFILNAFCTYCLFSATTSTILFILSLIVWKKSKQELPTQPIL